MEVVAKDTKYLDLLKRLSSKKEKLSFSSFSQFAQSPAHFINYKMRNEPPTKAMIEGSVFHCIILEEEEFDKRYVVMDFKEPSTDLSKEFVSLIVGGMDATEAHAKAGYKNSDFEKAQKAYESYKDAINFYLGTNGRRPVTPEFYEFCQKAKEKMYKNDAVSYVLNRVTETEKFAEWKYCGFNWRGVIDGKGDRMKMDLKLMASAEPKKAQRKIYDMKYHWQGASYQLAESPKDDYFIVAIDRNFGMSVHKINHTAIQSAYEEMESYMTRFKRCIFEGAWHESYNYHLPHGINQIGAA